MNSKLPYILTVFTFGCISLLPHNAIAQDGGYPSHNFQEPSYQELNLNEDKSLIYDVSESSRASRTTTLTLRDSTAIKAAKAKMSKKTVDDKKGEDALSFNFLYYIIQKYKISDIVDQ